MRFLFAAKLVVCAAATSWTASAALVNGNFDADVLADGASTCSGGTGFTGWTSLGGGCGTGLLNPTTAMLPGGNAPSNGNVAYLNGTVGYWQQSAVDFWTAGQATTFEILVGQRLDEPYLGYSLELWAGAVGTGTLVASTSTSGATPAAGAFVLKQLSFTPTGSAAFLGQPVSVAFRGGTVAGGVQTVFDNAALNPAPEPGTYALVGSALIALASWRRRRAG